MENEIGGRKMRLPILIKRDFNKKPHFLAGIGKKVAFSELFC